MISCDPQSLANASRCFDFCVSAGNIGALKSFLLCKIAQVGLKAGGGGGGSLPLLTNFLFVPRSGSGVSSQAIGSWDLPPAPATATELWTSPDNITYALAGSVAGSNLAVTAPAVGSTGWAKARWVNATTQGPFCAAQQVSGRACDWARRCIANGALATSLTTRQAVNTLDLAFISAGLDSKMIYVLPFAPDSLLVAQTPLYKNGAAPRDPALNLNGLFVAGDLSVNGLQGDGASKGLQLGVSGTDVTATSAAMILYGASVLNAATYMEMGYTNDAASDAFILRLDFSGNSEAIAYDVTQGDVSTPSKGAGYYCSSRVAANDLRIYYAKSTTAHGQIGATYAGGNGAANNHEIWCFVINHWNAGAPFDYSGDQLSFAAVASGLAAADSLNAFNAIQAYRTTLGGGFV